MALEQVNCIESGRNWAQFKANSRLLSHHGAKYRVQLEVSKPFSETSERVRSSPSLRMACWRHLLAYVPPPTDGK
jgi:hypothetical protein